MSHVASLDSTNNGLPTSSSAATQVVDLYVGALGRATDAAGLAYWSSALASGTSLHDVAAQFLASSEYQNEIGGPVSDTQFVNAMYQNIFHTAADSDGAAYWTNTIAVEDRAQVLVDFSSSAPSQVALQPLIGQSVASMQHGIL